MTGQWMLDTDIRLARQFRLPVLITAAPDRALALAHAIAAGDRELPATVVPCDGAAIVSAAGEWGGFASADGEAVLLVLEAHELKDEEQAALLQLLSDREGAGCWRIIATSSVWLWERVEQGTFDATLFYRLNAIHIVSHSGSEGSKVGKGWSERRTFPSGQDRGGAGRASRSGPGRHSGGAPYGRSC